MPLANSVMDFFTFQKCLETSTPSHSTSRRDDEVSDQQEVSAQQGTHPQDSPTRREGEDWVGRVSKEQHDVGTPSSACEKDSSFLLNTPEAARSGELFGSNAVFFSTTEQLFSLIDSINEQSVCSTPGCGGVLKHISMTLVGLGGDIEVQVDCSGCDRRRVTYPASASHEQMKQHTLSLSLQVACIAAGLSYAQYEQVFGSGLGVKCVTSKTFFRTVKQLFSPTNGLLQQQCNLAKAEMKSKDPDELGSWQRAVTVADGAWLTRGHFSQNFTLHVRNYLNGAILFYRHLCQRGKDDVCPEPLYEGTSKFAEGHTANLAFEQASGEGMNVEVNWQDADSTSAKAVRQHFPEAQSMLCGGHSANSHYNRLKSIQAKKTFSKDEIKKHDQEYPQMESLSCHCTSKHKVGCGCMTDSCFFSARAKYIGALNDAGTDPQRFIARLKMLGHHAQNEHEWEGGECDFHCMYLCSCGKCERSAVSCEGKRYATTNALTCPFHSLAYEIELGVWTKQADNLIHSQLGKGHTNSVEAAHNVLIRFRPKSMHLHRLHYQVATNLGLLQSNQTFMGSMEGMAYHWYVELLQLLDLPVHDGVGPLLQQVNSKRKKKLDDRKGQECKRKRRQWKHQHRRIEQDTRKEWGKKQRIQHTYGGDQDSVDPVAEPEPPTMAEGTPSRTAIKGVLKHGGCKCGSKLHKRSTHRDCPLNSRNRASKTLFCVTSRGE